MTWVILWIALSIPVALTVGAFIGHGNKENTWSRLDADLGPEFHDQTVVG